MAKRRDPLEIRARWMIELQEAGWDWVDVFEIMSRSNLPPPGPVPRKPGTETVVVPLKPRYSAPYRPSATSKPSDHIQPPKPKDRPATPKAEEQEGIGDALPERNDRDGVDHVPTSMGKRRGRPPKTDTGSASKEEMPERCPIGDCPSNQEQGKVRFRCRRRGTYRHRASGETNQRWECLCCGRSFTRHMEAGDNRLRKPEINEPLIRLLGSGVSIRQCAKELGVSLTTVEHRIAWLERDKPIANRVRKIHGRDHRGGPEPIPFCAETVRRMVAEGKREREIAAHFGVTPAAVYQWRYRGKF